MSNPCPFSKMQCGVNCQLWNKTEKDEGECVFQGIHRALCEISKALSPPEKSSQKF